MRPPLQIIYILIIKLGVYFKSTQKNKNCIFENTALIINYFYFIKCFYRALWSCSAIFSLATESINFIRFNWFTSLIPASQSIATIFTPS